MEIKEALSYIEMLSHENCLRCMPEIGRGGSFCCDFCKEAEAYDFAEEALKEKIENE